MATQNALKKKGRAKRSGPIAASLLIVWLAAAPLLAQDGTGVQASLPVDARSAGFPSERTAFTLSLATTLASWGLLLGAWRTVSGGSSGIVLTAGIMVGPSFGSFYGGLWGRGLLWTGLRLGVSALALSYSRNHDEEDNTNLNVLMLVTLVGSSIYECATVKSAVRKHNAARLARRGTNLALAPFLLPNGAGLQVRLGF